MTSAVDRSFNETEPVLRYVDDEGVVHGLEPVRHGGTFSGVHKENTHCGLSENVRAQWSTHAVTCITCLAVVVPK